jgi:CBS domain-containing protein
MLLHDEPVSRFMSEVVLSVGIEEDIGRADEIMRAERVSAVLVRGKDGAAAGVISRRDLLRAGRIMTYARRASERHVLELPALAAADLMTRPVVAVAPGESTTAACRLLAERRIHRVFVLEGGAPAGVFSTRDVMAALREARVDGPLGDLVTRPDVISVETTTPVREALETLERAGVGGVIVLEDGAPVGMFTEREALEARARPPTTPTEDVMTEALLCLPRETPVFRAAAFAMATSARRILVTHHHRPRGVVSGLDFARAVALLAPEPVGGQASS